MCPNALITAITAAAAAIAEGRDPDEIAAIGAVFTQLGDTLATIAVQKYPDISCATCRGTKIRFLRHSSQYSRRQKGGGSLRRGQPAAFYFPSFGQVYRAIPLLCLPYSIASLGQRQMQAMQWVQFLPHTGFPSSR